MLSEAGTTFGASDVTVSGGTLSNFAASQDPTQPNTYTATVTPTQIGPLTVSVAAGAFTDASGNPNIQGSTAFSVDAGFSSLDPAVVIGTVEFGNTGLGYALRVGGADGAVVQVKQAGQYVSQLGDWVGIGARADGAGGYELLWQNDTQFFGWALDADGNYLAGAFLTPDEIFGLETDLNQDINGDGDVGLEFTSLAPAVVIGTVEFGNTGLGYALRVGGADGAVVQVKQAGQYVSQLGDWVGIGARADGAGGYELLWQNDTQFFGWALDADGNYLAGAFLTPDEIFGLETDLNQDINGDGDVGLPPS